MGLLAAPAATLLGRLVCHRRTDEIGNEDRFGVELPTQALSLQFRFGATPAKYAARASLQNCGEERDAPS